MDSIKEIIETLSFNWKRNPSIIEILDYSKSNGFVLNQNDILQFLIKNYRNTGGYVLPDGLSTFIADLANFYKPSNLLNLGSGFGEILSKCKEIQETKGVEINNEFVTISSYLYPEINFENIDPLELNETEKYDVVTSFPPIGRNFDSIRPLDELYIEKGLKLLKPNGVGIFLVSPVFISSIRTKKFRGEVLNNYNLNSVISLNSGGLGFSSVELFIIVLVKNKKERTNFYRNENYNKTLENFKLEKVDFSVYKDKINDRWDYHFHNPKNYEYEIALSKFDTKRLEDLVEIVKGLLTSKINQSEQGDYLILTPINLKDGQLIISEKNRFIKKEVLGINDKNSILRKGDIILSKNIHDKLSFYIYNDETGKYIINQNLIILRGNNINYVSTFLKTVEGEKLLNAQLKRHNLGYIFPTIPIQDLKKVHIPILPIDDFEVASEKVLKSYSIDELYSLNSSYEALKRRINELESENNDLKYHRIQLDELNKKVDLVLKNQYNIDSKLDIIINNIRELANDFKQIKELPRDIDDKISKLETALDKKISLILKDSIEIDDYVKDVKKWLSYYDYLEANSRKYIPEAEFIFDYISKLKDPDYSPFILQYCRALENELLIKIFRGFVQSLIDREINIEIEFSSDFELKQNGKYKSEDVVKIAKLLMRYIQCEPEKWFFELGSMEVNLRNLTGKTLTKSPLLQDLKKFVLDKFQNEILDIEYLDEIKHICVDFRNQSAHPNLMETEKATEFHKIIKTTIIQLLETYRKGQAESI